MIYHVALVQSFQFFPSWPYWMESLNNERLVMGIIFSNFCTVASNLTHNGDPLRKNIHLFNTYYWTNSRQSVVKCMIIYLVANVNNTYSNKRWVVWTSWEIVIVTYGLKCSLVHASSHQHLRRKVQTPL